MTFKEFYDKGEAEAKEMCARSPAKGHDLEIMRLSFLNGWVASWNLFERTKEAKRDGS